MNTTNWLMDKITIRQGQANDFQLQNNQITRNTININNVNFHSV